ncbi:MAG TPA: hypothetical protein VGG57_05970 [Stellaceae bacterium]|jgi:hypothetical protein
MERNRWTTAIRCLEIALHPNTSDDEVLAAVNGFRRTAGTTPLSDICAGVAPGNVQVTDLAEWTERFARLSRENLELRRRLDTTRQIDETQRRLSRANEELAATQRRARLAEQRLDDARDAYAQVTEGLKHEIAGLRAALEHARNAGLAHRSMAEPAPLFSDFLTAAQQGTDHPRFIQPVSEPSARSPWTA